MPSRARSPGALERSVRLAISLLLAREPWRRGVPLEELAAALDPPADVAEVEAAARGLEKKGVLYMGPDGWRPRSPSIATGRGEAHVERMSLYR
ncbi:MAG TPA: hypothetical protein VHH36_09030 [Candidatus Thermoplasmatota archaeon]|nr:hypothetical protein [Candidatus Thermoplasmatota archaeon]